LPKGIKRIIRGQTDFIGTLTRTQVIGGEKDMPRRTYVALYATTSPAVI
jgi:hypothetical protein